MMRHHVTAILWQCGVSPEHVYDRPDNILPLSRYVTIYASLEEGLCTVCAVCGVKIRVYSAGHIARAIKYFINKECCISIGRRVHNDDCDALRTYFSRSIGNDEETVIYGWHRDGRLRGSNKHGMNPILHIMPVTPCTQDCSIGTAVASMDAFFDRFLHFRVIRTRQK